MPPLSRSSRVVLHDLVMLSHELGREERHLVLLGEGNCSAAADDGTFWIKASGMRLASIDASGFSCVRTASVLPLLASAAPADAEVQNTLGRALINPRSPLPSVETFLHAVCLTDGGARWVAHTHPVAVNSILCSQLGAEPFLRHIFPDAIVVCGKVPCVVPYSDPGVPLARSAAAAIRAYLGEHAVPPRMVLIVNHGLVALGQTATEVLNITLMADKWARILLGAYTAGGPQPLLQDDVERIDRRPDELYRRQRLSRQ